MPVISKHFLTLFGHSSKALLLGVALFLSTGFRPAEKITKEQAIKLAEDFIRRNGYTSEPADKSKLSYELLDQLERNDVDSLLNQRSSTLQPKAFCISEDDKWGRWNIGFLATSVNLQKLDSLQLQSNLPGRAVIVSFDGKEVSVAHKEPLFSYFKKL